MKKLFLSVLLCVFMATSAFAGQIDVKTKRLKDSTGTDITALAIASAATVYSETLAVNDNVGFASVLATEGHSGGTGGVALSVEYSNDGTNFYTVNTTSGGTLTADSAIITSLVNTTKFVQYTSRLAKYLRYKIVAASDSVVTLDAFYQQDR